MNTRWVLWLVIALAVALAAIAGWRWTSRGHDPTDSNAVEVKMAVEGALDRAHLVRDANGSLVYVLQTFDGGTMQLAPDELAARLYSQSQPRNFLALIFNISSPIGILWVSLGLLGQLLFTGRMLVQWLVSEKHGRSIVPAAFWWMSMGGAMMLLVYFIWRRDIVGVLGQSFGLIVYIRNIHLIQRARSNSPAKVDAVAHDA